MKPEQWSTYTLYSIRFYLLSLIFYLMIRVFFDFSWISNATRVDTWKFSIFYTVVPTRPFSIFDYSMMRTLEHLLILCKITRILCMWTRCTCRTKLHIYCNIYIIILTRVVSSPNLRNPQSNFHTNCNSHWRCTMTLCDKTHPVFVI